MTGMPIDPERRVGRRRTGVLPEAVVVFLLALVTIVPGLFGSPLVRTEPHRAIPAHEMVVTGRWLMPRIYGEPYLRKPPLHYWALAAVERATGRVDDWIYRLPSAIATALLAAAACLVSARWFGTTPHTARCAGLAAGVATLALVPLWGQARTADVDALNTAFGVVAAWLAMEVIRRRGVGTLWPALAFAVAFLGATLTKGPATWPLMIGAVAATAWVLRPIRWRSLLPLVGAMLLAGAVAAVWIVLTLLSEEELDLSGVGEVASKFDLTDLRRVGVVLGLPVVIALFSVPVLMAIGYLPAVRERCTSGEVGELPMAFASALGFALALVVGALVGLDNMRYVYPAVPLLAPIVGAVAAAWAAGTLDEPRVRSLRGVLTGAVFGYGVAAVVLAALAWRIASAHGSGAALPAIAVTVSLPLTIVTIVWWIRERLRPALAGTVLIIAVTGLAFGAWRAQTRSLLSSSAAAAVIRETVGAGATVLSGEWVMADPSVFHYAGVDVDYLPRGLRDWTDYRPEQWVVFERGEWERLAAETRAGFDPVIALPVRGSDALLARYGGGGLGADRDVARPHEAVR